MKSSITVHMYVKRTSKPEKEYLTFSPEEFFDVDEDEPYEADSVQKHLNVLDYFDDSADIYYVEITISDPGKQIKRQIETTYFDRQESQLTVVTEYQDQKINYREIISDMILPAFEENAVSAYEITRFCQENGEGEYHCTYHVITTTYRDGTESDIELPSAFHEGKMKKTVYGPPEK